MRRRDQMRAAPFEPFIQRLRIAAPGSRARPEVVEAVRHSTSAMISGIRSMRRTPDSPRQTMRAFVRAACAALGLLVMLGGTASSGGLTGILGMDDRVPVESNAWPWSAIGRVNLPTGGFCTGAVIGPRHILTAAHCLYDHQRLAWFGADELEFVAGGEGRSHGSAVGTALVFAMEEAQYRDITIAQPTRNWAILIVDRPLGLRPIPWRVIEQPGLVEALEDGKATLVRAGYSEDSADRLSAHIGCDVAGISRVNGLMLHGCDATLGDAGSPLLLVRPGGDAELLAINVAVQHDAGNSVGVAVPASAFDEAARITIFHDPNPPATY